MKRIKKYTFLVLILSTFIVKVSSAQNWKKETLNKRQDSLFAVYSWEVHDKVHGAGEQITLTKKGRFKYTGYWPLNSKKFSEGYYSIDDNIITLNSDLQFDNVKANIAYFDTTAKDPLYSRLSFPKNNKGESIFKSFYYINYDTTSKGIFDPEFLIHLNLTHSIKSIKVRFWNADFGSSWIPIQQNGKFISVKINTDENFDSYKPKVLKNWKLKIYKNRLIDFTASSK